MFHKTRASERRHKIVTEKELNITAFLNLMINLIPFLLITAVFSRMTVLEIYLPSISQEDEKHTESQIKPEKERLDLFVSIREDGIIVRNGNSLIESIPRVNGDYDMKRLSKIIIKTKGEFPDEENVIIMSEPDISYDMIVQVMDACRMYEKRINGQYKEILLFPTISIGEITS
ncbi:MAG: ExbD/TolR family protein [Nitrospirota bacterium]